MSQEKVVYIEPGYSEEYDDDSGEGTLHVVDLSDFTKSQWRLLVRQLVALARVDKKAGVEIVKQLKTDFGLSDANDVKLAGKVEVVPNTSYVFIAGYGGVRELSEHNLSEFIASGEKLYREVYPTQEVLGEISKLKKKASDKKKKLAEAKKARAIAKARKILAARDQGRWI